MYKSIEKPGRLLSLDVMRGLIMLLLAGESCLLYTSLKELHLPKAVDEIVNQFFHHPWHGLHFWDLVQPAFMLMAGAALHLSFVHKQKKGITWRQNLNYVAVRSFRLFICGTALHCVYAGQLVWELWNVLTQLAFTTLIAYFIIRVKSTYQIALSLLLLTATELLYRSFHIPNFDQPFVEHKNFGAWMDTVLMGKINDDGWVAINIIPTAAHTIWGVLAGRLLIQSIAATKKIAWLCGAGVFCLIVGYTLDFANVTPIIKRISTSSFVFASGGWVLLMLSFIYWLIDVKGWNRFAWIFVMMGMNAIFIYLLFETLGVQWLNGAVGIFVKGFSGLAGLPLGSQAVISAVATLFVEWWLCYWLYKRNIFFKL